MWYAIISEDVDDSRAGRATHRTAHLARLQQLANDGRLLAAGPHPKVDCEDPGDAGFSGSLIIAEFDSLAAAQAWADSDPYVLGGVHSSVTVKPYKKVLP
ncbi:MAG: YciI family protein [Pseudomonadota bacterium]